MRKIASAFFCLVLLGVACQRAPQERELNRAEPTPKEPLVTKRSKVVIFEPPSDVKDAAFSGATVSDSITAKARRLNCPKPDWNRLYAEAQAETPKRAEDPDAAERSAAAACLDLESFEGLPQLLRKAGYTVEQTPLGEGVVLRKAMKDHPADVWITVAKRLSQTPVHSWDDPLRIQVAYTYDISIPAKAKKHESVVKVEHTEPSLFGDSGRQTAEVVRSGLRQKTAEALVQQEREGFPKIIEWLNANAE